MGTMKGPEGSEAGYAGWRQRVFKELEDGERAMVRSAVEEAYRRLRMFDRPREDEPKDPDVRIYTVLSAAAKKKGLALHLDYKNIKDDALRIFSASADGYIQQHDIETALQEEEKWEDSPKI